MSSALAERSVLQGHQEPRVFLAPEFKSSAGQEAAECAAIAGLHLDPWQKFVLHHALGEDGNGKWTSFRVGVCVPRQNGKGAIIEALELAWLFLFEDELIIHSAHRYDTSMNAFARLRALVRNTPEFHSRVRRYAGTHGMEGIELKDGRSIQFRTRSKDAGRGFTGDKIILDEAMSLKSKTMADLVPTLSTRPDAQLWFLGSAVDQVVHPDGVEFAKVREDGISGAERLAYFEWSYDARNPDDINELEAADSGNWLESNPSLGIRISEEYVQDERRTLGMREFVVERMGVGDWPRTDGGVDSPIDIDAFDSLEDLASVAEDPVWFAFDVSPDRARASISAAGRRPEGGYHMEVVASDRGTGWVAEEAARLKADHKPAGFLCDGVGPAMSLLPDFERLGVSVEVLNTTDHTQACAFLFDQVEQRTLRHLGQESLRAAVRGAARRPLEDRWAWSRKNSAVDITPLVSSTLALWGAARGSGEPLLGVMFT